MLIRTVNWKKTIHFVKPVLVGFGMVLLLASMVESIVFLNEWVGFVSFGVDSVTYYPFDVYSTPVESYFQAFHNAAIILVLVSVGLPLLASGFKKLFVWRSRVQSS
jgi:hypothetical protein